MREACEYKNRGEQLLAPVFDGAGILAGTPGKNSMRIS